MSPNGEDKSNPGSGGAALVTGASSGIGEAIARKLAAERMHVFLVARRAERLAGIAKEIQSAGGSAQAIPADLSDESDRLKVYRQVLDSHCVVDVLVNNAGLGWYGYYSDMPWSTAHELIQVNITTVAQLTRMFLPEMRVRGQGHVINIGSIAGSLPSQGTALYSASKAYLDAFTTALHRELRNSGVCASLIRAGPVASEFFEQAERHPGGQPVPAGRFGIPPQRIAEHVWRLIERPRRLCYVPGWLWVIPWVELLFGWLEDRVGPFLLKKPERAQLFIRR